jgi:predicted RNase H-like HicB family nuclease
LEGEKPLRGGWGGMKSTTHLKVMIEKHPEGYIAYPLRLKGVIVSQGETYDAVLQEATSAIRFHIETFGSEVWPITKQIWTPRANG